MLNVTSEVSTHIEDFKKAKEMWNKLHELYNAKGFNL